MSGIPLSLYIHFPWCVRKCPYCDFNSHESSTPIPVSSYIDKLLQDLAHEMETEKRRKLTSIFLGGGTPSLFPPEEIDRLIRGIAHYFDKLDIEITLEANPGTFDQAHFSGYRKAGVNRISIGAQSFSATALRALGRIHEPGDIETAFVGARKAGFDRINLDLMHGLPGQSLAAAMSDLNQAMALGAEHLSWYQLTIEPNTLFYKQPPTLPPEDTLADIFAKGQRRLHEAGFNQYEVSAYAKPGEEARHNVNYWEFGDYLGIGAGAHGKVTRNDRIIRSTKTRMPDDYLREANASRQETNEPVLEFLMNVLRLNRGFDLALFEERCLMDKSLLQPFLDKASDKGFLQVMDDRVMPTRQGRLFLNELLLLAQ